MKKILLFLMCFVFLFVGESLAKRSAITADKANVRSGPGTEHQVLWSVGKYYPLDIIEKKGNWFKIKDFEGDQGWIFKDLVGDMPAVIVKVPLANVRQEPDTKTRVLFQAEKGVSFKQLTVKGQWIQIQHVDGDVGWIHESLVWGY